MEDVNVDQTNDTRATIRIILGTGPSDYIFPDRFALEQNTILSPVLSFLLYQKEKNAEISEQNNHQAK